MLPPVADKNGSSRARLKFLCVFGEELIKPNMQLRAQCAKGLNLPTANAIKALSIQITCQKIWRLNKSQKRRCHFPQEVKIEKFVRNAVNVKNTFAKNIQKDLCVMIVLDLVKIECFKYNLDIFWEIEAISTVVPTQKVLILLIFAFLFIFSSSKYYRKSSIHFFLDTFCVF